MHILKRNLLSETAATTIPYIDKKSNISSIKVLHRQNVKITHHSKLYIPHYAQNLKKKTDLLIFYFIKR